MPILVCLCRLVLDLGQIYATERQTSGVRQTSDAHHRVIPLVSYPRGRDIIMLMTASVKMLSPSEYD